MGFAAFDFVPNILTARPRPRYAVTQGKFDPVVRLDGHYLLRDHLARYERVFAKLPDGTYPQQRKINANTYTSSTHAYQAIFDGHKTLLDTIFVNPSTGKLEHHLTVHAGDAYFKQRFAFPLNLGVANPKDYDLYVDLENAFSTKDRFTLEAIDAVTLENSQVLRITLSSLRGVRTYWVDVKRGAIPAQNPRCG